MYQIFFFFLDVAASKIGQNIQISFRGFLWSLQPNSIKLPQFRPKPLLTTAFPFQHLLASLAFNNVLSGLLTVNKRSILE